MMTDNDDSAKLKRLEERLDKISNELYEFEFEMYSGVDRSAEIHKLKDTIHHIASSIEQLRPSEDNSNVVAFVAKISESAKKFTDEDYRKGGQSWWAMYEETCSKFGLSDYHSVILLSILVRECKIVSDWFQQRIGPLSLAISPEESKSMFFTDLCPHIRYIKSPIVHPEDYRITTSYPEKDGYYFEEVEKELSPGMEYYYEYFDVNGNVVDIEQYESQKVNIDDSLHDKNYDLDEFFKDSEPPEINRMNKISIETDTSGSLLGHVLELDSDEDKVEAENSGFHNMGTQTDEFRCLWCAQEISCPCLESLNKS